MKSERQYTLALKKLFENVSGVKFHQLPDTGMLTHRKPYDFYMIVNGKHISVEAKIQNGELQDHQGKALTEDADAKGKSYVLRYGVESMTFYAWINAKEIELITTRFRLLKEEGEVLRLAQILAEGV